jgi:hypothetical protein
MRTVIGAVVFVVPLAACAGGGAGGTSELPPGPPTTAPAATGGGTSPPAGQDPVLASYLRFWDAVVTANRAADPALPRLATVAADPELTRVRDTVSRNKIQRLSLRGEVGHSPKPPAVSGGTATVEDCYDISRWNPVNLSTGKPIEVTEESGTGRYRARYTLRRSGAAWLVVDQKALGGC